MRGVHRTVDLRHLRAFAAIVEAGGFARAAHEAQPQPTGAVSADPCPRGRARRAALRPRRPPHAAHRGGAGSPATGRRLLTGADSLSERARALKSGQTGLLRVGATPQVMETLLARFLQRYRRGHPAVEVHLVEDGGIRLPAAGARRRSSLSDGVGRSAVSLAPAGAALLLAVLPTRLRGRRATLEVAELVDSPLLLTRRDFGSREWFDAACQVMHMRPRVLLESGAPPPWWRWRRRVRHRHPAIQCADSAKGSGPYLCSAGCPIGRWLSLAWDPRDSWRRMRNSSSKSWSTTRRAPRRTQPSPGARRPCRDRKNRAF